MGAFTSVTFVGASSLDVLKTVTCTATAPASYDANGSVIDLSTAGGLGALYGFTRVDAVMVGGITSAHTTDPYRVLYVRAAAGAAASGTLKIRDLAAASDAEASGNLSALTLCLVVHGQ